MLDIDSKIKTAFKLFQGIRDGDEDRKIYDQIYSLCLDETINFLEENLDLSRKNLFIDNLKRLEKENNVTQQRLIELTFLYLQSIPHYRFRLNERLDAYLNNLLYRSAKERQKRE